MKAHALLALSLSSTATKLGAIAAFAALLGIALLAMLFFAQARELKRLREWAGRAPERFAELEARIAAQAAAGVGAQVQRPPHLPGTRIVPRATPMVARVAQPGVQPTQAGTPPTPVPVNGSPGTARPAAGLVGPVTSAAQPLGSQAGAVAGEATPDTAPAPEPSAEEQAGQDAELSQDTAAVGGAPVAGEPAAPQEGEDDALADHGAAESSPPSGLDQIGEQPVQEGERPVQEGERPAEETTPEADDSPLPVSLPPAPATVAARAASRVSGVSPAPGSAVLEPSAEPQEGVALRAGESNAASTSPRAPSPRMPQAPGAAPFAAAAPRGPGGYKHLREEGPRSRSRLAMIAGGSVGLVVVIVVLIVVLSGGNSKSPGGASSHRPARHVAAAPPVSPGRTSVTVLNSTTVNGLAHRLSAKLRDAGYVRAQALDPQPPGSYPDTVVEYSSGKDSEARGVAKVLGVGQVQPMSSSMRPLVDDAMVAVVVGQNQAAEGEAEAGEEGAEAEAGVGEG